MYPGLLLLHNDVANSVLAYRHARIAGAEEKAQSYSPPFTGTMFPWESAFTGCVPCDVQSSVGFFSQLGMLLCATPQGGKYLVFFRGSHAHCSVCVGCDEDWVCVCGSRGGGSGAAAGVPNNYALQSLLLTNSSS
jgi:hypothetical protein